VVAADGGAQTDYISAGHLAYPDICAISCWCVEEADWVNCPWTQECGKTIEMIANVNVRKEHARHLGGSNIGFLDGHAAWFAAERILAESPRFACGCWGGGMVGGKFKGIFLSGPTWSPTGNQPGDDWMRSCGAVALY